MFNPDKNAFYHITKDSDLVPRRVRGDSLLPLLFEACVEWAEDLPQDDPFSDPYYTFAVCMENSDFGDIARIKKLRTVKVKRVT